MMDASRRGILKMFGVAAAAGAVGVTTEMAVEATKSRGWGSPFELAKPPPGITYNWKRLFTTDDESDLNHIVEMIQAGWKPVPMSRHREQYPAHPSSSYWIEIGGVVLMEKSTEDIPAPKAHPLPWELKTVDFD